MLNREHDYQFKERLQASHTPVAKVAAYLESYGYHKLIVEDLVELAPTYDKNINNRDRGDIRIWHGEPEIESVLDVKGLGYAWKTAADKPYSKKGYAIVTGCKSLRRLESIGRAPLAYIHLNITLDHVLVVTAESQGTWFKTYVRNGLTGRNEECWAAPLDQVRFAPFDQLIRLLPLGPPPKK